MDFILKGFKFYGACLNHGLRAYIWRVSPERWPNSMGAFIALLLPYFALTSAYASVMHLWPLIPATAVLFIVGVVANRLMDVSYRMLFGSFLVCLVAAVVKLGLIVFGASDYLHLAMYVVQTAVFMHVIIRTISWEQAPENCR